MSLIVDINPVPWKILDLVRARILKNRAKKAKKGINWSKERLKQEMSLQPRPLSRQKKDEAGLILPFDLISISILFSWQTFEDYNYNIYENLDIVVSMTYPVTDGPLGTSTMGVAKYISHLNDDGPGRYLPYEAVVLGRPQYFSIFIPESKEIDNFFADYPNVGFVRFSLAAYWRDELGKKDVNISVIINLSEESMATILDESKVVTLVRQPGQGQSLGVLEVGLDGSYAKFV
jgi:hypothetical protein